MQLQFYDLQMSNIFSNFCSQIDIIILRILANPGSLAQNVVKEASAKYIATPHCLASTNQMLVIILANFCLLMNTQSFIFSQNF